MANETKNASNAKIMITFFLVWVLYAALYMFMRANPARQIYAGYLSSGADIGLLIVVVSYACWLWFNAESVKTKLVFGLYFATYICIFISDVIYNIIFNVLRFTHTDLSLQTLSVYNIPYLLGLILLFLCFANIVPKVNFFKWRINIPIVVFLGAAIFNLFFLADWTTGYNFSLMKVYDIGDGVFELANFVMAIICFVVAKDRGIFYFGLGYIIIIAADFIMNTGMLSQHFGVGSLFETTWILGLFFVIFALHNIKKTELYKTEPKMWINENNSLSTTFSFWIFILCNLTLAVFLFTAYLFSPALFF